VCVANGGWGRALGLHFNVEGGSGKSILLHFDVEVGLGIVMMQ
jgi:hypothetical protein